MGENKLIVETRFNEIADIYDKNTLRRKKYNDAVDKIIIETLLDKKPSILDAGCGTGSRAKKLKSKIPGSKVHGFDLCKNMVDIAKTKGLESASVQDISSLKYSTKFDAVTCLFFVITYLDSKTERLNALKSIHKVLKPNGFLFIDAMNLWHLGEGLEFKRSKIQSFTDYLISIINPKLGIGDKRFETQKNGHQVKGFFHGFTDTEMRKLLKNAGFRVERKFVVGYNSGEIKRNESEGQLFYVCRVLASDN